MFFHRQETFYSVEYKTALSLIQYDYLHLCCFPLGGGGVVWTKLQEVLSSVEDSISSKRSWAAPITASDQDKHQEHLRAAQESWVKATQVLKL